MYPFYLGCAVWGYKGWVGELFPPGTQGRDFLRLYSRRMTTVEGNTTFYATPDAATVVRWAEETPEQFRFCFKLPREVSHQGPLVPQLGLAFEFLDRFMPLGPRRGPYMLQLPPGYHPRQIADLERFLATWVERRVERLAVEVRHLEWWGEVAEQRLMQVLDHYHVSRALLDVRPLNLGPLPGAETDLERARDRKPDVPLHPLRASDTVLLRYISHPDVPLNAPLLDAWAEQLATWLSQGVTVYAFMHCPIEDRAPSLCRELQRRLAARIAIPPLPWDTLDDSGTYVNATLPGF